MKKIDVTEVYKEDEYIEDSWNIPPRNQTLFGEVDGEPILCVHKDTRAVGTFQKMQGTKFGTFKGVNGSKTTESVDNLQII